MQLSKMQNDFWHNCTHRWNIKEGATRSGKTYMDYYLIARRLRESHNKQGLRVLIGNTRSTLERNIIDPMRDIWGEKLIGSINQQNNTLNMFGEKVYALGADKRNQVDKIRGSGFIYCYGDEVTTWSEEVFEMLKSRLSFEESVFDGTCNPDSPRHWFRKFLNSDADIYKQSYTIYDNPFLPEVVKRNLEIEYQGTVYFDRYILGKWTLAEGLIYKCYDPERDPIEKVPEPLTGLRCIACDYGTSNPCVFLLFEKGLSGTWYLTEEYYYSGRDEMIQKSDEDYCNDFIKFVNGRDIARIIVDPSAASFITALRQRGFEIAQADNAVLTGIRNVITMLNNGSLKILSKCTHTLDEIGAYRWNPKSETDEPIKEDDHCCDCMRYFANSLEIIEYDPFS